MIQPADTSVLDRLLNFATNLDLTAEFVIEADNVLDDTKERVASGKATDGSTMDTKAADRSGRYSRPYAKERSGAGLTTSTRDLSFTGEMIADLGIIEQRKNYVSAGFRTGRQADIAEYNERYMGVKAFDTSESAKQKAIDNIQEKVSLQIAKI